ncbi:MAG: FHA domain-containing protein [Polyangiaceae bacterium]|nr:FHA domain-containing protein [Polyangiaceae bacterium]
MPQSSAFSAKISERQVLVLRFISGKYEGGEFPLDVNQELLIGRATDADLVLVEELVSRHHATLTRRGSSVRVSDLGSTNGTFVNGERVRRAELTIGDRLLIGTSILKLIAPDRASISPASAVRSLKDIESEPSAQSGPRMRGDLAEIPVTDLVQLLANGKKSGVLVLRAPAGAGKIVLQHGQIVRAELLRLPRLPPEKALYRLMGLAKGQFELEAAEEGIGATPLGGSTEHLVIESMRHFDEVRRLAEELPRMSSRFSMPTPLLVPLEALDDLSLALMQDALNAESFRALLDSRPENDLEVMKGISKLLQDGYLVERHS